MKILKLIINLLSKPAYILFAGNDTVTVFEI